MKVLKKILGWLSAILVIGGLSVIFFTYVTNKPFINYLSSIMTNAQFGTVMRRVLYGVVAVIIGLIAFALSLKAGSVVRKKEKERRAIEKEEARKQQEMTEQMRAEAKQAMAEAEAMKKEAEEVKLKFAPNEAEEAVEEKTE